jgi:hypothetical protein
MRCELFTVLLYAGCWGCCAVVAAGAISQTGTACSGYTMAVPHPLDLHGLYAHEGQPFAAPN